MAARDHLTPFVKGDGRAVEAGKRSAEARAVKREAQRVANLSTAGEVIAHLNTLANHAESVNLAKACIGVAIWALGEVAAGKVPMRHGGDVAELVKVLVDVARLEAGLSTSNSVVAHLSSADARARLAELRSIAAGVLDTPTSATAVAAEDIPAPSPETELAGEASASGGGEESSA